MLDPDTVRLMSWTQSSANQLLVAGTGGLGRETADAAAHSKRWRSIAFLDGDPGDKTTVGPWQLLGDLKRASELRGEFVDAIVALADSERRVSLARELLVLQYFLPCVVHPTSYISASVRLDYGCAILAQAAVGPEAEIGMSSVIGASASVAADCRLGAGVTISAGAHIGMGAMIGNYSRIGIGAVVEEGVRLGSSVTVGAGAVVVDALPDGVRAEGVPARIVPP